MEHSKLYGKLSDEQRVQVIEHLHKAALDLTVPQPVANLLIDLAVTLRYGQPPADGIRALPARSTPTGASA